MRHISFIDQTGLHNLRDTVKILIDKDIIILLSGVNQEVKEELRKYQLNKLISEDLIFDNFKNATQKACEILDQT